jgi:hypothetical protein
MHITEIGEQFEILIADMFRMQADYSSGFARQTFQ